VPKYQDNTKIPTKRNTPIYVLRQKIRQKTSKSVNIYVLRLSEIVFYHSINETVVKILVQNYA